MKSKIILIALFLVSLAQAQDKKQAFSFSLKEAIEHAVQNNYSAKNASKDVEAAKQKKWETTAMGLPQVNGSLGYQDNFILQKSLIPAELFGGTPGTFAAVAFGTKQNMGASIGVTQLLFDGSYLVGLQASKVYLKISENAKIKTNQEIKELVIKSYGNVLLADESIKVLEKNKAILDKTLFDTKETYKNGLIEEENVEQLQITLSSVKSALANTNRMRTIANDMLKLLLGIDLENDLTLKDKLDDLTQNNIDLALLKEEFNVTNAIDYQIGKNAEESKSLLVKLEKSKALPSLGLGYNLGANAFANDFNFMSKDQKWLNYSNLGVNLKVPLFSSFARSSRTQQAKIALEQAKTQLTETEQKLKLQFEQAKSQYEYSLEQFNTAKNNLSLSERIENKQQIKFKEGLSSSFNLTEAQRQLYTAQQNYLQTMVDVINSKATLEKLLNKN